MKKNSLKKIPIDITTEKDIQVDYHIHTNYTDGKDSIENCVKTAIKIGLEEIAFTDHVWRTSPWVDDYVNEIKEVRKKYPEIKIWIGLEAKAINRGGDIDVTEENAKKVDFILGVVHRKLPEEKGKYSDLSNLSAKEIVVLEVDLTKKLLQNKLVDVIGHPTRTYYKYFYQKKTEEHFPVEYLEEIAKEAALQDKPLEYNARVLSRDSLMAICLKTGVSFTLGSDAHNIEEIGKFNYKEIYQKIMKWQQKY